MSNVISFNVYKNTLRRSSGNDPVSSESGYTEILCRFKEGDDWEGVNGGIVTAGFFVNEETVYSAGANLNTIDSNSLEARFKIPGQLVGNRNPIYFGITGSYSVGNNNYETIATNVVKLDVIRGVVVDNLQPAVPGENPYQQMIAVLNDGLTSKLPKLGTGNVDEIITSKANGEVKRSGVKLSDKADAATVASLLVRVGAVEAKNAEQDTTIGGKAGKVGSGSSAEIITATGSGDIQRSGKSFANSIGEGSTTMIPTTKAVKDALDTKANAETVQTLLSNVTSILAKNAEQDAAIAGKAAADHTHSEYLTAQDISGKEDKSNKFSTIKRSQGEGEHSGYPSVYAVRKFLQDYYYSKTEIDDTTYTKDEVNTALAEKAAANHTHSEYLTETEASELISGIEELKTDVSYDLYSSSVKAALYNYMSAAAYTDYTYTQGDYSGFYTESNISVSAMTEEGYDLSAAAPVTVPENAVKCVLYDTVTKRLMTQTVTSGYAIKNLIPNHPYIYIFLNSSDEVLSNGTVKAKGQVRFIDAQCGTSEDAPFNVRDLGGWACDGGQMKYGLIYRGSELNVDVALTNAQKKVFLDELNVGDEIDLRDVATVTDTALDSSRVNYVQIPINYYNSALNMNERGKLGTIIKRIAQNLREGRVTYIHCQAGADRTATVCALLEAVCGVSNSDIDRDYEITSFSMESYSGNRNTRMRNASHSSAGQSGATWINYILRINNDNKDTSDANDSFQKRVVRLLIKSGASIDDINDIRAALIDGNPQKLEHPYGKATITANLTNVNISNTADSVYIRQPFEAFLYTDDLYAIKNVSVTMGGSNVTSSCYNHGRISISSVTGDVVITASASNTTIPTKTSDLTNDSGFLTSHQDISGKEDKSNKVTSMSASSTDAQYPTAKAVYDKIRSEIQTAIGGIENGSY